MVFEQLNLSFSLKKKRSGILCRSICETDVCFFPRSSLKNRPLIFYFFAFSHKTDREGEKKNRLPILGAPPEATAAATAEVEINSPRPSALSFALASEFLTLLSFSHIPRFATCAKKKKEKEKTKEFGEEKLRNLKPSSVKRAQKMGHSKRFQKQFNCMSYKIDFPHFALTKQLSN